MRNTWGAAKVLHSVYLERETLNPQIPARELPLLNDQALPLHRFVTVDLFIPGCPPAANTLFTALSALASGRAVDLRLTTRFGA
jgi:NAD-reducing hydrogenase small subunit